MLPTITYGETQVDFSKLPETSVRAMLSRGLTHFLGSEQASKVTSHFTDKDGNKIPASDEDRASKKAEFVSAALGALLAGTVGVSTRGPAKDPLASEFDSIVKREVTATLKAQGLKFPKDGESIEFANGTKRTGDEMLTNYGTKHKDRIESEAKKAVADKARAAKKMADKAAEALGDL